MLVPGICHAEKWRAFPESVLSESSQNAYQNNVTFKTSQSAQHSENNDVGLWRIHLFPFLLSQLISAIPPLSHESIQRGLTLPPILATTLASPYSTWCPIPVSQYSQVSPSSLGLQRSTHSILKVSPSSSECSYLPFPKAP